LDSRLRGNDVEEVTGLRTVAVSGLPFLGLPLFGLPFPGLPLLDLPVLF